MLTPFGAPERIAHRGMPRERTENTLPGFLLSLEHGADAVELDVHLTSDGKAVVHHDFDVAGRSIAATPWADLAGVELPGGARIPLLEDVLIGIGERATVYVELKGRHIESEIADVVRRHGHRYAVHSFDHHAVARSAAQHPEIPRGVLLDRGVSIPIEALGAAVALAKPRDVWPHWSLVDARFMAAANQLDVRVIVWTVNDRNAAKRLRDLGVAGICSDDVRLLANLG